MAALTGWDEDKILDLPLVRAYYYQLKAGLQRGELSMWVS